MRGKWTTAIVALAERQHGLVARWQLLAFGLSARMIDGLVQRGSLRRIHAGVYAVGHAALRDEGRWLAAVLACGQGAVLATCRRRAFGACPRCRSMAPFT